MNALSFDTPAGRFAVPAFVAAAGHAALLFLYAPVSPLPPVSLPEPPPTIRPIVHEPVVAAPAPEVGPSAPVRALRAGPVRPVTEDRAVPTREDFAVEQTRAGWKPDAAVSLSDIPGRFGDGTTGPWREGEISRDGFTSAVSLDRIPRARVQVAPDYPVALRQAGVEGHAMVEFEVDAAGTVVAARVRETSAREFGEAAVRAVLRWRFEPGRKDGRIVPFRMAVPIGFRLGAE